MLLFKNIFHPTLFFLLDIHFLIANYHHIIAFLNIIVLIFPYFIQCPSNLIFKAKVCALPKTFIL